MSLLGRPAVEREGEMPTSIIAIFLPCVADSMWLSKVVFPLPRKPVRIVTGTRSRRISHPAYAMTTRDARDPDLSSTQTRTTSRTCAFTPAVGRDTEKWA